MLKRGLDLWSLSMGVILGASLTALLGTHYADSRTSAVRVLSNAALHPWEDSSALNGLQQYYLAASGNGTGPSRPCPETGLLASPRSLGGTLAALAGAFPPLGHVDLGLPCKAYYANLDRSGSRRRVMERTYKPMWGDNLVRVKGVYGKNETEVGHHWPRHATHPSWPSRLIVCSSGGCPFDAGDSNDWGRGKCSSVDAALCGY
jgi:hypothetical protein